MVMCAKLRNYTKLCGRELARQSRGLGFNPCCHRKVTNTMDFAVLVIQKRLGARFTFSVSTVQGRQVGPGPAPVPAVWASAVSAHRCFRLLDADD